MYGNVGEGIIGLFWIMIITLAVSLPLSIWKVAELLSKLFNHIHWN